MFDLADFDAEISRVYGIDRSPADVKLARAYRGTATENAIATYGVTTGMFVGAIGLAMLAMPILMGSTSGAQAMTFTGMTMDQFAVHMNMSVSDPLLATMFEDSGKI